MRLSDFAPIMLSILLGEPLNLSATARRELAAFLLRALRAGIR